MKSLERKYEILKAFLKQYKSRKFKDDEVVSIIEEMVADYESAIITLDIHKRKKGGVRK
jgi:hypothetical protein